MKKYFNLALIIIGMIVFLGGLFLYGLGVHEIIPVPRQDLLPWSTSILGILFIISGVCELFFKKTKEMQIEESDERNVAISNSAKATGFEVMTCLFSITILVMALLGYLTKGVFFTFIGVFSIAQISFVIRLLYLQRTM